MEEASLLEEDFFMHKRPIPRHVLRQQMAVNMATMKDIDYSLLPSGDVIKMLRVNVEKLQTPAVRKRAKPFSFYTIGTNWYLEKYLSGLLDASKEV